VSGAFEKAIAPVIDDLCEDCPMRNLSATVELARFEAEITSPENAQQQIAAIEADSAANIVVAALYKARNGCEGAVLHEETCECGNDRSCTAYGTFVDLISSED